MKRGRDLPSLSSERGYTMEEVTKHNKKGDVWVVLSNVGTQVVWSL